MTDTANAGTKEGAEQVRALFEAKAAAELAAADALAPGSDLVPGSGALFAHVVLVKALAGPAEACGGSALSGADGRAAALALGALGYDPGDTYSMLSRPEPGIDRAACSERLRLAIEAVDPRLVIALDGDAAEDLARAFGTAPLRFGKPVVLLGRTLLAVDGLEASLTDPVRKRRVWRQLQSVKVAAAG